MVTGLSSARTRDITKPVTSNFGDDGIFKKITEHADAKEIEARRKKVGFARLVRQTASLSCINHQSALWAGHDIQTEAPLDRALASFRARIEVGTMR
jgi:hypothetical protein